MPAIWKTLGLTAFLSTALALPGAADYVTGLNPQGDNYLALRSGPGTNFAELMRMGPDTILTVLETSGNWRRVALQDGTTGWAYGKYIAPGLPPGQMPQGDDDPVDVAESLRGLTGTALGPVGLRRVPSMQDPVAVMLRDGGGVIVLGSGDGWLRVIVETGQVGYVLSDAIAIGARPTPMVRNVTGKGDARPATPGADSWQTFYNSRFGSTIDYPADYFLPDPAPGNNDGRSFHSIDEHADFIVFGQYNVFGHTLASLRQEDIAIGGYDRVTYDAEGADWYVLSGFIGNRIFYRKVLLRQAGEVVHVFHMTYPEAMKARLDPVVTRMSRSYGAD